jgi:FAD:protein FMN transferase
VSAAASLASPVCVAVALEAMATRFELVLPGDDAVRLRAAGEDALREVERAEALLSRYRPTSPIAWINARAGGPPVRVDPRVFRLLEQARDLARLTGGAFDPTVGPLLRAWGFVGGSGHSPDPGALAGARALVGVDRVELDAERFTARLPEAGMELDLGAIGKGWAVDAAIERLVELGVTSALLHGGTSSVHVLGRPGDGESWRVGWRVPAEDTPRVLELSAALSVSAPHGKAFEADGRTFGHVLDPRSGWPVSARRAAAVRGPSSTVCDALSTALLVMGEPGRWVLAEALPGYTFLLSSAPRPSPAPRDAPPPTP